MYDHNNYDDMVHNALDHATGYHNAWNKTYSNKLKD